MKCALGAKTRRVRPLNGTKRRRAQEDAILLRSVGIPVLIEI
jgi:hypothetical protein